MEYFACSKVVTRFLLSPFKHIE